MLAFEFSLDSVKTEIFLATQGEDFFSVVISAMVNSKVGIASVPVERALLQCLMARRKNCL